MLIFNNLIISDKLKNKKKKIINALRHGEMIDPSIFVVYLNENTSLPELMQGYFFNQIYYHIKTIEILGIFASKDEGIKFLSEYITESYNCDFY